MLSAWGLEPPVTQASPGQGVIATKSCIGYTACREAGGLAIGQCPPLWELEVFVALLFNDSVAHTGQGPSLRRLTIPLAGKAFGGGSLVAWRAAPVPLVWPAANEL